MKVRIPFLLGLLFVDIAADYCATRWGLEQKPILFFVTIILGLVASVCWLFALKHGVGLGRGNIIFAIGSSVLTILLGYVVFHESYTTFQLFGLILGIVSIGLVTWGE